MEMKLINGSIFKTYIDMKNIEDSLQLDSDQTICSLENNDIEINIEVKGEVKVWWNPNGDPMDGEYFTRPSEFPEELKNLIVNEEWYDTDEHIEVTSNNWFEIFFVNKADGNCIASDVIDVEGYDEKELLKACLEYEYDIISKNIEGV